MHMLKRLSLVVAFVCAGFMAFATADWRHGERQNVWPDGKIPDFQAHQVAAMTDESKAERGTMPYLEWFAAPEKPNGACMILVSGGSYDCCCDIGLIRLWRDTFTKLGYQTVNLVYRTPRPRGLAIYQTAWEDGQRAVRLVRSQAKKRGFDPEKIGVIGMSAGGHLVTMLATSALTPSYAKVDALDDLPCHVNVAIANAPAYNTVGAAKGDPRPEDGRMVAPKVNPCFKFDAKTCPITFHHGGLDPYTSNGSTLCYLELRKRGVPTELHLYSDRGHGAFGLDRAVEFLNQIEFASKLAPEVELMTRYPSDDARASYEKQAIWPEGQMPDVRTNQCAPYIEWHLPKVLKTKAIQIVYSGGAYNYNGPESFEVTPIRRYLNAKGMAVVTMKYRTPRPAGLQKHQTAWEDLQRAIRVVRSQAAARGLDPNRIGIMGSSAGGHLTMLGVTSSRQNAYAPIDDLDKISCKVQWGIAIYPAYMLTDGADGHNKDGGNAEADVLVREMHFDMDTAPVVFIHGDADDYSAMGSVKSWEQMRKMGVQSDLHTLALRNHCFQMKAAPGTGSFTWMDRAWDFLTSKGFNK